MTDSIKFEDLKILVVDDDEIMHVILSRLLRNLGVRNITTVGSGSDGLARLDSGEIHYDIILCDLNMPEMDGVYFLRRLAERKFTGGLAFLSSEDERLMEMAFELAIASHMNCLGTIPKTTLDQDSLLSILENYDPLEIPGHHTVPKILSQEEFRDGFVKNALVLYFQPKVLINRGIICSVEALARWKHAQRGILAPQCFIPVAMEMGMIDELTLKIYEMAIKQLAEWRQQGAELDMSINVSINTFSAAEFPSFLIATARTYAIDHAKIILEITESDAMNDSLKCMEVLMSLRMKRFGLSIDDFGTGHSSLSKLKQIPFTELKIDRAFVDDAMHKPSSRAILESSVDLARKLKMNIVAEGVETRDEWDLVRDAGCDYAQGFFCARPMPGHELIDFIRNINLPV